ncbi:glycosyltransferase involved in cell wall biosynthesis [Chryseobacterium rhizosphaerae]|uniref:Glycosyltransferase involved in cell wall biosynthesis n=1 Tax=Chryseobacterium rhizosphaerae TaxID=395937 RepID=A0AAE4C5H1_9FLAO|nr:MULTISPECIES: glycosyltransferase family 4 protein [Chryseobacterium]MBL3547347.1 glycosyltransferase family 4 protein [Chryseobacterium sp. KMC2]MDR6527675.1 glycosyltransferase involved in cell wall biosynthesis [Chryseobacterium rhizosphaerae]
MKILIPLVGTFSKEGGWRVLSELANRWLKAGHEVVFLSHKKYKKPYFPTDAKILFYDNKGNISESGSDNYPLPFGGPFPLRRKLIKALNQLSADVVLATQNFTAGPIKKSTIKAKKFYYIQAYEPEFYDGGPLRYKVYKQIAINSYKKGLIHIVNAPMYQNFKEIMSDKVVFPGIDLDKFYPKEYKPLDSMPFIIGSIGRTEIYKGTSFVIEAFQNIRKSLGNKVELHLAFGNEDWNNIDGVKVFYPKNDKELADYYRTLNCYVCAGYLQMDAIHYPVIEAMSCNVPVITTGYYPSSEENSYKIKIKDSQSIVDKIYWMMDNYEETTIKSKIALQIIQEFDWDRVANKMLGYFFEK